MVELTVALAAGAIVALGVIGLSHEATTSFHEEVRAAAAEANLRTAVDRLRADIQRAGYMSTGNIWGDPLIAKSPLDPDNLSQTKQSMGGIRRLAAINLGTNPAVGGSLQNTKALSNIQAPPLNPDAVEIGGNMTSADQFTIFYTQPAGSCTRIWLNANSPAILRIKAVGANAPDAFRNLFQPTPKGDSSQFIVRIADHTGHYQYLATCLEPTAAYFDPNGIPYVDIDNVNTPLRTAQTTQTNGGLSAQSAGQGTVNPVQIVRWEITNPTATNYPAQYQSSIDLSQQGTVDPNKYDLVRTFYDARGIAVPSTTEVVAEFAVDLKLAFSVDTEADITGQNPLLVTYAFEDTNNAQWGTQVDQAPFVSGKGPQRIRSVRVRLVTRAAMADRSVNIPVSPPNFTNQPYLYRYCLSTPCGAGAPWARARTVVTEVALTNQERSYY
jgi:hypothetical protein